ncbi:Eco57I restriction-modification methylase domain-containing protein [Pontibacter sp. CAU 1760]
MAQLYSPIFSRKYLKTKAQNFHLSQFPDLAKKRALIEKWQSGIKSGKILKQKEEELQSEFLNTFFGEVLEYVYSPEAPRWNLSKEHKSDSDSTKADGALGYFWMFGNERKADVRAVIELKDARTDLDKPQNRFHDKRSPVEQAFSYVPKAGGNCRWVLVSNFLEIRLYHHSDQSRYEQFDVMQLHEEEELLRFLFQVHKDRLILEHGESATEQLYRERQAEEQKITKNFYADYKKARLDLFRHLHSQNPEVPELTIFQKTQKLLDRVVFVCFCEDLTIIPPYTFRGLLRAVKEDKFNRLDTKIYERVKGLFSAIDKGYPEEGINKFNGGLFAPDVLLDNLQIKDSTLEHIISLEKYDFASDLNVNILGHIFEQSISDIEETKAEIAGQDFEAKAGKRKKDGIFYTPEYITRYIVKEAVGGWLQDRQRELGFQKLPELAESDYASIRFDAKKKLVTNKAVEKHLKAWDAYREALRNIKVLDPACGSGAFLNQVFDFLFQEGQRVNKELARLRGGQFEAFDLDRHILNNNIFGVDLNEESVEITKLSLWLKTANKSKELTTLDANIKCGNSLVSDPAIAGEKAFDWQQEFYDVFATGGFDVVVGNPPYGATVSDVEKKYFDAFYSTTQYNYDTYKFFFEKASNVLNGGGYLGYITPNTFLVLENGVQLRKFLFEDHVLISLLETFNVFADAIVEPLVSIFKKARVADDYKFHVFLNSRINKQEFNNSLLETIDFTRSDLFESDKLIFNYRATEIARRLRKKIKDVSTPLVKSYIVTTGVKPYQTGKGTPKQTKKDVKNKPFTAFELVDSSWSPLIRGTQVNRYSLKWDGEYIKYGEWLAEPRGKEAFLQPKLFIRRTDDKLLTVYDENSYIGINSVHTIVPRSSTLSIKFLEALLNSGLMKWVFQFDNFHMVGKPLAEVKVVFVERLPIIIAEFQQDFIEKADLMRAKNRELQELANKFITLLKAEFNTVTPSQKMMQWYNLSWSDFVKEIAKSKVKLTLAQKAEWISYFEAQQKLATQIQQQLQHTDNEIDQMVYQLYDLTTDEIELINH